MGPGGVGNSANGPLEETSADLRHLVLGPVSKDDQPHTRDGTLTRAAEPLLRRRLLEPWRSLRFRTTDQMSDHSSRRRAIGGGAQARDHGFSHWHGPLPRTGQADMMAGEPAGPVMADVSQHSARACALPVDASTNGELAT